MVSISKPKWVLLILLPLGLIVGSVLAVAVMEGAFMDPAGQLNNPVTLECNSGLLANRTVPISDDGEYNWMLIKDQLITIKIALVESNHTLNIFWHSFSSQIGDGQQAVLNSQTQSIDWVFRISQSGHWRLEMINNDQIGHQYFVSVFVNAQPVSHSLGLIDCLNPGDLFRTD